MPPRFAALALVALSATTAAAQPCPSRYYFVLFASESVPYVPRSAHTWGVYAQATPTPDGQIAVEHFAISWLPADGNVEPSRLWSEPGRNSSLDETFALMAANNARVSHWGPYEIDAIRYELAREQARHLESGVARYRALDSFNLDGVVVNCVHAVTHADPAMRNRIQPVIRVGEPGTSRLARLYVRSGAFPHYPETADWLVPVLGLDRYPGPVVRREPGETIPRQR